jgi:hypothetical protein
METLVPIVALGTDAVIAIHVPSRVQLESEDIAMQPTAPPFPLVSAQPTALDRTAGTLSTIT